jgi:UDP-3-O-[3-hydroxymyristoyl] glucosamine N-acyltransferase
MKLKDLKPHFLADTKMYGNVDAEIGTLKAMHLAKSNDITYILAARITNINDLINHPTSTIITDFDCSQYTMHLVQANKNIIQTSQPRLQMAKFSHLFDYDKQDLKNSKEENHNPTEYFYHPTAYVHSDTTIGDGTKIYANVSIYAGVKIGKNCTIHSGSTIGADGFGYEQDQNGTWFKIAHLGGVVIGDNVEIGANTCIDRGTLGDTIIDDGTKIDNLVHIAHNVHVKKNAMIIANAMVAGSAVIGEGAWIAPSSSIREGRKIGDRALIGLGSVVVKDVAPGITVMGVPAKEK